NVVAIAVTSFGESFVPVSKNGENLSKIIMYTDKRGKMETEKLIDTVGYEKIMDIVCTKPDSMYSLPKIMWMMNNVPGVREKVWKFILMQDYICYKLSGETGISYSLATRTMAFDLANRCWSTKMLDAAGITKENLSEPVVCGSIVGNILKTKAKELGLPNTVKIVASAHDQVSSAFGAGVIKSGEAIDGTGSVECITPLFDNIIRNYEYNNRNFVCVPCANTGLYATYAFNFAGGVLLKWFRDTFAQDLKNKTKNVYKMLDDMCPSEPSEIIVVPHFMGAGGTPEMVNTAKGTITGMTMDTKLPDIYRAVMEGLTFEMAYNIESLGDFGINIGSLRATGGGARSPIWLQIKADILNKVITPLQTDEAGAAGCAMLAAVALGKYKDLNEAAEKFVKTGESYIPSDKFADLYKEKYNRFKIIRNSLLNVF
ncbi:MAG: FGGY family carbohydrate kinase, partial [Oscillospiraceae bacterium]|nr:FGGY family carbohydrate kinase [Oscillospiraceae bacterium]